jgi:glycyl-tRNA synthetase alpha chain
MSIKLSKTSNLEKAPLSFQEMIFRLSQFWAGQGCVVALPYDLEVGAGTMCPETFFRVLGPQPWRVAYVQPSRRPADGRYGENPNRLLKHTQMQVILKPPPANVQDMYLQSLEAIGIEVRHHDIRFEEDNWEAPTLGAWGVGWQVVLDGLEISQFTYFQQSGGLDLEPISVELTYGLERITAFLQNVEDVYHIRWNESVTYGDMRRAEEMELSVYDFEAADPETCRRLLDLYEGEATRLLAEYQNSKGEKRKAKFETRNSKFGSGANVHQQGHQPETSTYSGTALSCDKTADWISAAGEPRPANSDFRISSFGPRDRFPLRKVYDLTLQCSHLFNILDARGAISVTERVALIARVRKLACSVAAIYVERQTAQEATA